MTIQQQILNALLSEGRPEAMVNAMSATGSSSSYEQVFREVMDMENRNLIKLVYCQFPGVINVQITLVGQAAAKKQ